MNFITIKSTLLSIIILCFTVTISYAQDTVYINEKNINTKVLKEGVHRYLVYFKKSKDAPRSQTQFWTRSIQRTRLNDKSVIKIDQIWEFKDTVLHTVSSICDAVTMKPITHEFWWSVIPGACVDFEKKELMYSGALLSDADTAKRKKAIWSAYKMVGNNYFLNWHADLEVFPTLPFKKGRTFIIPFYDPGTAAPFEKAVYTVSGEARLEGYNDRKIDCWLLVHEAPGNKEVFWISKKTKEVLKLEQLINGTMYRYKIKLGFSDGE